MTLFANVCGNGTTVEQVIAPKPPQCSCYARCQRRLGELRRYMFRVEI